MRATAMRNSFKQHIDSLCSRRGRCRDIAIFLNPLRLLDALALSAPLPGWVLLVVVVALVVLLLVFGFCLLVGACLGFCVPFCFVLCCCFLVVSLGAHALHLRISSLLAGRITHDAWCLKVGSSLQIAFNRLFAFVTASFAPLPPMVRCMICSCIACFASTLEPLIEPPCPFGL